MESFIVEGSSKINGIVEISGSKNSALPILASTILNGRQYIIRNVPDIEDVRMMFEILITMGCTVEYEKGVAIVDTTNLNTYIVPEHLVKKIRSSIILMGAVLCRTGFVEIAFPGGCEIGLRPIDLHLKGLEKLGVDIQEKNGILCGKVKEPKGSEIHLDYPSVGATENIMLFAVGLNGITTVHNAAREPEIIDLQNFLNASGYEVDGAGSGTVTIRGKINNEKEPVNYKIISDRIEAGTYLAALASSKGKIYIKNIDKAYFNSITSIYEDVGCEISELKDSIVVSKNNRLNSIEKISTQPYPGFPTDMQAQLMASMTIANGTSIIKETVFENRFKHVPELQKMGADITIVGRAAIMKGVEKLYGAEVEAKDLRGGAALVIAAIAAEGTTKINNIHHIDRGYEKFREKFSDIGVEIKLI